MVLPSQLEINRGNRDKARHDKQHDESQEEDTKQGVNLVTPNGVENIMKLDVDSGEGQEAREEYLGHWVPEGGTVLRDL